MPKEIGEVFFELISKIWRRGRIPNERNSGTICPVFKKGERNEVKNYRCDINGYSL